MNLFNQLIALSKKIYNSITKSKDDANNNKVFAYEGKYFFKYKPQWRDSLQKALEDRSLSKNNLLSYFENYIVLSNSMKNSASNSIIVFATCPIQVAENSDVEQKEQLNQIAMKFSFYPLDWTDNTLEIEREFMHNSIQLLAKHTPNLITYIKDDFTTTSTTSEIKFGSENNERAQKDFERGMVYLHDKIKYGSKISVLIMERCMYGTLFELIQNQQNIIISEQDWISILAQSYWFLTVLKLLGIRHNDMHLNNILIHKATKPEQFSFQINTTTIYQVASCYIVEFFDFDRATIYSYSGIERAFGDDFSYCLNLGQCSGTRGIQDISSFNMGFAKAIEAYPSLMNNRIIQFMIYTIIGYSTYSKYSNYPHSQSWMIQASKNNDFKAIQTIKTPLQCLEELCNTFNISTLSSSSDYYYTLPPPYYIQREYPNILMLSPYSHNIKDIYFKKTTDLMYIKELSFSIFQSILFKNNHNYKNMNNKINTTVQQWNNVFNIWIEELDILMNETNFWYKSSAQLYKEFGRKTGYYPTRTSFYTACITLSCSMYYGLSHRIRFHVLEYLNTSSSNIQVYNDILEYEVLIWKTFNNNNNKLPIIIPILYNLSEHKNILEKVIVHKENKERMKTFNDNYKHLTNWDSISLIEQDRFLKAIYKDYTKMHDWIAYFNNY